MSAGRSIRQEGGRGWRQRYNRAHRGARGGPLSPSAGGEESHSPSDNDAIEAGFLVPGPSRPSAR